MFDEMNLEQRTAKFRWFWSAAAAFGGWGRTLTPLSSRQVISLTPHLPHFSGVVGAASEGYNRFSGLSTVLEAAETVFDRRTSLSTLLKQGVNEITASRSPRCCELAELRLDYKHNIDRQL
jgi:hypothetical protein